MKLKMRSLFGLLLSLVTLVMFGCGDDGGPSTKVSGTIAAGIVSGGTVTFFPINTTGTVGTQLTTDPATVTTAADGTYTATIGYSGPLQVVVTGGTYTDEATGKIVTLTTPLRAALPNATGTVAGNVTPLTEVAVQKASTLSGGLTAANITSANTSISSLIGVTDILTTAPVADTAYNRALQTLSQVQNDTQVDLSTALSNLSQGITINTTTNTATVAPATQVIIDTATDNIGTNPNIAPTVVVLTASPTTGVINSQTPVTITAAVTFASNAQPVPDGATVSFAITSGTGTLSAASAVTSGGTASVTLSSTTAGDVVVSAAIASSATATVTVPFINDPTAPAGISVAASQTSLFVGQGPVTITATVSAAGGAGSTVPPTVVTFITTNGILTSPTLTTNGVATVLLDSTSAVTASVTARVNGITSAPVVVQFNDPNAPAAITVTANPTSGVVGTPVAISAAVTRAVGGIVPDGTSVAFAVTSGTGTLSAATAITTGGIATVNLIGGAAGNIVVTATSGAASGTVSVPFILQPTLAIVKVATTGTLPAGTTIGGVNAIVSASPVTGLTIAAADITATGAGAGSTMLPNANNVAAINLGLLSTSGIQTGEFATLNYHLAAGTFPTAGNFSVALTGAGVIDTLGVNIAGIGVTILSVTLQ